jgi:hypothetical protein
MRRKYTVRPPRWLSGYFLFILRALLANRAMPQDGVVADWIGVRRETVYRARQRVWFAPWLREELSELSLQTCRVGPGNFTPSLSQIRA